MEKTVVIIQNHWSFEQIYSFRTVIYFGKTIVLGKNYGTMEKLWYYTEKYGTFIKYGKNYSTMEKKYGTLVNNSKL